VSADPVKVVRTWHPDGAKGAKVSLEKCAARIQQDYLDPLVIAFARRALAEAGNPKSTQAKGQAILDAMKKRCIYVLDPVNAEAIVSARHLLCLDENKIGMCMMGGDCDCLTCCFLSCCMAIGIDGVLVGQAFNGSKVPTHVLASIYDSKGGRWYKVDPSTKMPVGQSYPCSHEVEVDPLTGKVPDFDGPAPQASFVGVGAAAAPFNATQLTQSVRTALVQLQAFARTLSPHDIQILGIGEHLSHAEEAAATGDFARAQSHINAVAQMMSRVAGMGDTSVLTVQPGDILSYRVMWDQYVLDTVRSALFCAQNMNTVAQQQTDPNTRAILQGIAKADTNEANAILSEWNLFTGYAQTDPSFIVLQGATILTTFQKVVLDAGQLRENLTTGTLVCGLQYVDSSGQLVTAVQAPDLDMQKQIIAQIEGLGILARGTLQSLESTTTNGLVFASNTAQQAVSAITSPAVLIALAVGAVAVTALVFSPQIKAVLAARPAKKRPAKKRPAKKHPQPQRA
jgi:hypothetical protein